MTTFIINGERREVEAGTLADLLRRLDYDAACLATAVNDEVVARDARDRFDLRDGDRIEILSPMQGG